MRRRLRNVNSTVKHRRILVVLLCFVLVGAAATEQGPSARVNTLQEPQPSVKRIRGKRLASVMVLAKASASATTAASATAATITAADNEEEKERVVDANASYADAPTSLFQNASTGGHHKHHSVAPMKKNMPYVIVGSITGIALLFCLVICCQQRHMHEFAGQSVNYPYARRGGSSSGDGRPVLNRAFSSVSSAHSDDYRVDVVPSSAKYAQLRS